MSQQSMMAALERLCKWRSFFTGWQLGTRGMEDGESRAVRNHRELTILLSAEVAALTGLLARKGIMTTEEHCEASIALRAQTTAVTGLLLDKGVFTAAEFEDALEAEAVQLEKDYQRTYPGWRATDEGMHMDLPEALETQHRLGFPP